MRICKDCGKKKKLSDFSLTTNKQGKRYRRHTCTKCRNIKQRYGITGKQFFAMLREQLSRCVICEEKINESTAVVDHDSKFGNVRRLLCHNCNVAIGHLKHDAETAYHAFEYLRLFV